jgi:undecaprenyl-diphosphatase
VAAEVIAAPMMRMLDKLARRGLVPPVLAAIAVAAAALWSFAVILSEIQEGDTRAVDQAILAALRSAGDPSTPLGRRWLVDAARDVTALGSLTVLTLVVGATAVFLVIARHIRTAAFVVGAALGGAGLVSLVKDWVDRPRPEFVPPDVYVATMSFPSGHATMSAVVYLTIGALVARLVPSIRLKLTVLTIAMVLTVLVGASRVYLGVHWPTDVVGGWALGSAWALGWWAVSQMRIVGENRPR